MNSRLSSEDIILFFQKAFLVKDYEFHQIDKFSFTVDEEDFGYLSKCMEVFDFFHAESCKEYNLYISRDFFALILTKGRSKVCYVGKSV